LAIKNKNGSEITEKAQETFETLEKNNLGKNGQHLNHKKKLYEKIKII
jgi:hypothetical protein